MRGAVLLLILLLAGCGAPPQDGAASKAPVDPDGAQPPESFDRLTDRLAPDSATFQEFASVEDAIDLPGNGSIELQTGLGLMCFGDADGVAPNQTGWVACMARIVAEPDAMAQDVHDLGIGPDAQRLSRRQPGEPIEWRVLVALANGSVAFDSGWRRVDLSPTLGDPIVTLDVRDPCDWPDAREEAFVGGGQHGLAVLKVEFVAAHGRPSVTVDLGPRSRPGDGTSTPFAGHATGEHGFMAQWETFGPERMAVLELKVDLEAPEGPGSPPPSTCDAPLNGETQDWTVTVGITGPDGANESKVRTLQVDVVLDAN